MMDLFAFAAAYGGWTALFLAMDRHHRDVFGRATHPRHRIRLQTAGAFGLGLAAWASLAAHGGIGAVQLFGILAATASLVVVFGTYLPRAVPPAGLLSLVVATVALALGQFDRAA